VRVVDERRVTGPGALDPRPGGLDPARVERDADDLEPALVKLIA
jgi:hypothetical protein